MSRVLKKKVMECGFMNIKLYLLVSSISILVFGIVWVETNDFLLVGFLASLMFVLFLATEENLIHD